MDDFGKIMEGLKGLLIMSVAIPIALIVKYLVDIIKSGLGWKGPRVIKLAGLLALGLAMLATFVLPELSPEAFAKTSLCATIAKGIFTGLAAFILAIKANKWIPDKTADTPPDGG